MTEDEIASDKMSKTQSGGEGYPGTNDLDNVEGHLKAQGKDGNQQKRNLTNSKPNESYNTESQDQFGNQQHNSLTDSKLQGTSYSEPVGRVGYQQDDNWNYPKHNGTSYNKGTFKSPSAENTWPHGTSSFARNGTNMNHIDDGVDDEWSDMFDDDLEDVPPFDEIPSVLFLTGDIDYKTLQKSRKLYQQKQMLKAIEEHNKSKQADQGKSRSFSETYPSKLNKNKNVMAKRTSMNSSFDEDRFKKSTAFNDPSKHEHVEGRKKEEAEVVKAEIDLIRKKRLEKLGNMKRNYEKSRTAEQGEFRPALYKDDNRKVVMREEELMRQREKRKLGTDKRPATSHNDSHSNVECRENDFDGDKGYNGRLSEDSQNEALDKERSFRMKKLRTNNKPDLQIEEHNLIVPEDEPLIQERGLQTPASKEAEPVAKSKENATLITNKGTKKTDAKFTSNKSPNNTVVEDDDDDDDNDIPYAVRILMAKQRSNKPMAASRSRQSSVSSTQDNNHYAGPDDDHDDDDFVANDDERKSSKYASSSIKPIKPRTQYNKQALGSKKSDSSVMKNKNAVKDGSRAPDSYRSMEPSIFGGAEKASSTILIKGLLNVFGYGQVPTKPPVKNKNQTVNKNEDSKRRPVTEPTKTDVRTDRDVRTDKDVRTDRDVNPVQKNKVLKLQLSNVEKRRADAFRSIKHGHYQPGFHCSSCGRPDCNSMHVQKMREMMQAAKYTGFEVRDVAPDGNCMFAAVVDQLEFYSNYEYGSKSLREAAVNWLIENPQSEDGTPFESFLEEEWQTYLQRMLGEGQWGDHIVLRAIVEVTRHTVKVMSVDHGEWNFHILEPSNIDTDIRTVILGHVGEFHYVSLRTKDVYRAGVSTEDEVTNNETLSAHLPLDLTKIQLEGTESISMFEEGYIDPESGVPVLHFSYLLKKLIPRRFIEEAAKEASSMEDAYTSKQMGKQVLVGEVGNRVFRALKFGPEMKEMLKVVTMATDVHAVAKREASTHHGYYVLDESAVHPGFGRLTFANSPFPDMYIKNNVLKLARSTSSDVDFNEWFERAYIPCLICKSWPGSAQSWISRLRCENWPPQHIIDKIVSAGCLLKPSPHKHSNYADVEWQIGFELAEKTLFREAVTPGQQYCYMLWKFLIMQTTDLSGPLTLDHMRTVFLYACERIPVDFWDSNPGACVMYMLDELLRHINDKHFPNYFVPTNNMVDDLTDKELRETGEKVVSVRNQPLLFVLQFQVSCVLLAQGRKVIEMVQNDVPKFTDHGSIKQTTLEVLVPASTLIAREYLKARYFDCGFNMLSQAYEERLSVSTCDDTLPYHLFLQDALNELPLETIVWFSAYAELHLKNQLPKPIILELCGDRELVKICDIIPIEYTGELAETLVPRSFSDNLYIFCNELATFLRQVGRADTVRAVLYHAHTTYKNYLEAVGQSEQAVDLTNECPMMQIYAGLCTVYQEQGQSAQLVEFYPYMDKLVIRLNSPSAVVWLIAMYRNLKQNDKLGAMDELMRQMPAASNSDITVLYLQKSLYWPTDTPMVP